MYIAQTQPYILHPLPFPSSDGFHTSQISEPLSSNQSHWITSPTSPCYATSCWSLLLTPSLVPVFSNPVTCPVFWSLPPLTLHYPLITLIFLFSTHPLTCPSIFPDVQHWFNCILLGCVFISQCAEKGEIFVVAQGENLSAVAAMGSDTISLCVTFLSEGSPQI